MINKIQQALLLGTMCVVTACTSVDKLSHSKRDDVALQQLVVATFNVEHLAFPLDQGCKPRTNEELLQLQGYANSLNADVVALQEVASVKAVNLLFPANKWQIIISDRADSSVYECRENGFTSTQQKVAFAVRKGINVQSVKSLSEFALDVEGLRYGLELSIDSINGPMTLLNVHMKSGCFVDDYSRKDSDACKTFGQQALVLDSWVESKELSGKPYLMLGDFNHRLSAPYNLLTRKLMKNTNNDSSKLVNTTAHLIGCHPYYPAPIDHIFVGNIASSGITKVASVHPYKNMAPEKMLSDHCALSLSISAKE